MAYMSKEMKDAKAPAIKAVLKKYGMRGSIAIRDYVKLVVNVQKGSLDMGALYKGEHGWAGALYKGEHGWAGFTSVNKHNIDKRWASPAKEFLQELYAILEDGNHNDSDARSDYHDVGWYTEINIGKYNKPYEKLAC
jgi:hypothetical protein